MTVGDVERESVWLTASALWGEREGTLEVWRITQADRSFSVGRLFVAAPPGATGWQSWLPAAAPPAPAPRGAKRWRRHRHLSPLMDLFPTR